MPRKSGTTATGADPGSKSARTRQRILDAAAHVLSRKGYTGTRLADVASAAEVAAPAIYYYFASRDDLVEEVMWWGIVRLRDHVTGIMAALPPGAGPLDRIDAAVEAHLRYSLEISARPRPSATRVSSRRASRSGLRPRRPGTATCGALCSRIRITPGCCGPTWTRWPPG